jgi:hypothetical protein
MSSAPWVLWGVLRRLGVVVNFAHRTFRWTSEARGQAAVHCVIVGFALRDRVRKQVFDYPTPDSPPRALAVTRINPYLVDAPDVALPRRSRPLCDVPTIGIGNKPIDDGQYLFTDEERTAFLAAEPGAAPLFRPWVGADELLYGYRRWCLWVGDTEPQRIRSLPAVRRRVEAVQAFRRASRSAPTRALAATPTRFHVENMPKRRYLVIPEVSSETRAYIPMAFLTPRTLCSNLLKLMPGATPYHFGVLSSNMHMAWVRGVCGRLESRYRYSAQIVFNNFPWPDPTPRAIAAVSAAAEAVLAARAGHGGATLAALYDPVAMPSDLARAHAALDRAVDAAYGAPRAFATEAERLAFLFARYAAVTAPLDPAPAAARRGRSRLSSP